MPSYRSGLGFSASISHAAQRYCYARASSLDQLLAAPRAVELLVQELTGALPEPGSLVEQLAQLKRQAIHLSVTRSAFHGLSLEEIVVLCAYTSRHFEHSAFRNQLVAELSPTELADVCKAWLRERATHIIAGEQLGARRWPLVGHSPPEDGASSSLLRANSSFTVGVAPLSHSSAVDRDLPGLGVDAGFAHEHYIACTPATALDYVRCAAAFASGVRWDPFALDRKLRSLGLGLLLVEGREVTVYLPARYHASQSPPADVHAAREALTGDQDPR